MILVVLGTQKFQLNRLLKKIDELIETKEINEPVFAQIGNSDYIPKNYSYTRFLNSEEFEEKIVECDVLISHGGVGTLVSGSKANKPVILFPRLAEYNEHIDDHQLEIAKVFNDAKYVLLCKDENKLGEVILKSRTYKFEKYISNKSKIVKCIGDFLDNL